MITWLLNGSVRPNLSEIMFLPSFACHKVFLYRLSGSILIVVRFPNFRETGSQYGPISRNVR